MPSTFLKYFPRKPWLGKFISCAISLMESEVSCSSMAYVFTLRLCRAVETFPQTVRAGDESQRVAPEKLAQALRVSRFAAVGRLVKQLPGEVSEEKR